MSQVTGKVAQIIGPVVDVEFASGSELPKIYDSLEVNNNGNKLILEVQSHMGENTVRTISMDSTDGLSRGVDAVATGAPIQMPIGDDIYAPHPVRQRHMPGCFLDPIKTNPIRAAMARCTARCNRPRRS